MEKKKIIFLTNPQEERKIIYKTNHADYEINKELGIGDYLVDLDDDITLGKGYKETIKNIPKELNEWYLTSIPSVLNSRDEKSRVLWYDYDKKEWQIYFIDNGKLTKHNRIYKTDLGGADQMDNKQKWVVVESLNMKRYNTKDRFIFAHNTENNYIYSMGYVLRTGDFSLDKDVISVVKENSSVTFVPKVLHKSKKGIFYNAFGTRTYLTDLEEKELQDFIECFMSRAKANDGPIESYSYEDIKEY